MEHEGTEDERTDRTQAEGDETGSSRGELDIEQLKGELMQGLKDSIFAELRRSGAFGRKEETKPAPKKGNGKGESAGLSDDDVRAMMGRQREFERSIRGFDIGDKALSRMERAFELEQPDDVRDWVSEYVSDFGFEKAGGSSSSEEERKPETPMDRKTTGETPAPSGVTNGEIRDPHSLTEDDVEIMIRRHGMHKTGKMLMEALRKAPRRPLRIRRR